LTSKQALGKVTLTIGALMRIIILGTTLILGCNPSLEGTITVELEDCEDPIFKIADNGDDLPAQFGVNDDEDRSVSVWRIEVSDDTISFPLTYGDAPSAAKEDDFEELVDGTSYYFWACAAGNKDTFVCPTDWEGTFDYACPSS
jgi:hypothetical protein